MMTPSAAARAARQPRRINMIRAAGVSDIAIILMAAVAFLTNALDEAAALRGEWAVVFRGGPPLGARVTLTSFRPS